VLKITSPNLPTVPSLPFEIAPTLTLFNGTPRRIPPAFTFSKSPEPNLGLTIDGVLPEVSAPVGLGLPDYSGYLYKLTPEFTIVSVQKLSTTVSEFTAASSPYTTLPINYWVYGSSVYLYAERSIVYPGVSVSLNAIAQTTLPIPINNIYTIDLTSWGSFTPTQIYSAGVYFSSAANPSSPQPGEFKLVSGVLTLYGSSTISPPAFSTVDITLSKTFIDPVIPYLAVVTFDLTEEQVFYIDGVDYLGLSFSPARDPYAPTLNQYIWQAPYLTAFMDVRSLTPAKTSILARTRIGSQVVSTLTYNSGG